MSKSILSFTNFNRGINTTSTYDELESNELVTAINVDLKARGGYSQRKGCSVYVTLPLSKPVSCIINYPGKPLAVIDKSLRDLNNNVIFSGLHSNDIDYEFFTNSKLYILDGSDYLVYDGSSVSPVSAASGADLTPIKRCTRLLQRGQRMFALGDPQNPNYLYFSAIGNPADFQPSSIVKAVTDDVDVLTGLCLFSDSLLAFKKNEVFRWSGWDPASDVVFNKLDTGHGTIAPDSIKVSGDYLIFADSDGVFCLTTVESQVVKSHHVSQNIKGIWDTLTNKDKMKAIVYDGNYYLSCCDNGTGINNKVLKASLDMAYTSSTEDKVSAIVFPWVIYQGWSVSDWIIIDDTLYFGTSQSDGIIYKAFNGINDVTTPVYSGVTHYLKIGDAATRKKLKKLFIIAQQEEGYGTNLRIDIDAGYGSISRMVSLGDSSSWDISNWDEALWDWVDIVTKELSIGQDLTRVIIKISHERLDESATIYGFSALYKTKKPKGSRAGITVIGEDD